MIGHGRTWSRLDGEILFEGCRFRAKHLRSHIIGVPAKPGLNVLRVRIPTEKGVVPEQLPGPPYAFLKPGRIAKFAELFCVAEHPPQLSCSGTVEWMVVIGKGVRDRGHASIVGV